MTRIEIGGEDVTEYVRIEAIIQSVTLAFHAFGQAVEGATWHLRDFGGTLAQFTIEMPRRRRTGHRHRGTAAWARRYRSARPGVPLGQRAR